MSPGLVIHYFGSMEGLRRACDDHIADSIRRYKESAIAATAYLANVLGDDSPAVEVLVDHIVADAEAYFELGVETGMIKPADDPRRRAAVIALWSLGALVLHRHAERLLGVDLTADDLADDPEAMASYVVAAYGILGRGILTEEFLETLERTFFEPDDERGDE